MPEEKIPDSVGERTRDGETSRLSISIFHPLHLVCNPASQVGTAAVAGFETRMDDLRMGPITNPANHRIAHLSQFLLSPAAFE